MKIIAQLIKASSRGVLLRPGLKPVVLGSARNMSSDATSKYNFETLKVTQPKEFVTQVELNRPKQLNAMNKAFWSEMRTCFQQLNSDSDCRVIVLSGSGRVFTAGLDLTDLDTVAVMQSDLDPSRKAFALRGTIADFQEAFTVIEKCTKPVIAAIHNACIGGGIDMTSACDIRYATQDSFFQIKEVDIGLAADVGTLQRFPKIVGNDSLVRELTYTARRFYSDEAKEIGFISRIFPDKDSMIAVAMETAELIASKSPVAVQGSKVSLVYSRDHSVREGLEHVAVWNQGMIQSEDIMKAVVAGMEKKTAKFSKL
ncbi:delta(3,5)-Delta(2,4)-dienoyl-CoA isomerase, mitochondrial-like [Pecten maximus]|uniref:delta(3,5)-Delta(2,4)-dienoyl-CoA isomerase, mitochondrial-like n=1 Tax=Pecten maximus TaxID=6579 RepID=UPI001458D853|nr:delta(3,5)-Delta(2,4)-dienoyl-CoA isomerase, mitochondrial-like [Pecten maximus]